MMVENGWLMGDESWWMMVSCWWATWLMGSCGSPWLILFWRWLTDSCNNGEELMVNDGRRTWLKSSVPYQPGIGRNGFKWLPTRLQMDPIPQNHWQFEGFESHQLKFGEMVAAACCGCIWCQSHWAGVGRWWVVQWSSISCIHIGKLSSLSN